MGITSLQVCMDSSDWSSLQGAFSEDNTGLMGSPPVATPNGDNDILACSRPLIERRLRPNHEQALKCPRCESTHTKFCYYNNYSLTQPRYFCKTCRRYWTKGGTLRNIPVGGGCRKNKKVSSSAKKASSSSSSDQNNLHRPSPSSLSSPLTLDRNNFLNRNRDQDQQTADLQLAFPEQLQFSSIHGSSAGLFNPVNAGFLFENIMSPNPVEYMGSKYDHAFMGNTTNNNSNDDNNGMQNPSDHSYLGYNNPFGLMSSFENGLGNPGGVGPTNNLLESCQRLMLPYENENHPNHHYQLDQNHHQHHEVAHDVKPNPKILSLEWHDCNSDAGIKDSFGYNLGGLGSWTGLMSSGYGSSATNPLV